ncbi:MAG: adenylyl-sulfate kinase [Bacteroidia bacterium]|nr:adenylyl-sulfate kinase [Bacteroidia bacterium]
MNSDNANLHPVFDRLLFRADKEYLLKQHSKVLWMTGLSGSGKSSIAIELEKELHNRGFVTQVLDGDNVRTGINNDLGFSPEERLENIRRIAEISKLFVNCGIITINCFVSPTKVIRDLARKIIGDDDFIEIYVNAPVEICEQRDVKGLYKRARDGKINDLTGIQAPFEPPMYPAIEIKTDILTVDQSVNKIIKFIIPLIRK